MKFYTLVALAAIANASKLEQKPMPADLQQEQADGIFDGWRDKLRALAHKAISGLVQVKQEDGSLVYLDDLNVPEYGFVDIDDSQNVMDAEDDDAEMQSDQNPVEDEEDLEVADDGEDDNVDLGDETDLQIEQPGDDADIQLLEQEVNGLEE